MNAWMNEWMNEWTNDWKNKRTNERTNNTGINEFQIDGNMNHMPLLRLWKYWKLVWHTFRLSRSISWARFAKSFLGLILVFALGAQLTLVEGRIEVWSHLTNRQRTITNIGGARNRSCETIRTTFTSQMKTLKERNKQNYDTFIKNYIPICMCLMIGKVVCSKEFPFF